MASSAVPLGNIQPDALAPPISLSASAIVSSPTSPAEHLALSIAVAPARFVRPAKFEAMTGYTVEAIQTKIKRGVWLEGREFVHAPDGNILLDLEGYYLWAAGQRRTA